MRDVAKIGREAPLEQRPQQQVLHGCRNEHADQREAQSCEERTVVVGLEEDTVQGLQETPHEVSATRISEVDLVLIGTVESIASLYIVCMAEISPRQEAFCQGAVPLCSTILGIQQAHDF